MSIVSHLLAERVVCAGGPPPSSVDTAGATTTLAQLPIGCRAIISGFGDELRSDIARRLFDLGFVPGTVVEAARRAPLRDPVIYRVSGIEVALRSSESQSVLLSAA